ncbi:MAG: endonuclease III [Acidobacteriaceae bacterium]
MRTTASAITFEHMPPSKTSAAPVRRPAKKLPSGQSAKKTTAKKAAAKKPPIRKKSRVDARPERIRAILAGLGAAYPNPTCALHHTNAWELTVATILSAQCTDARVNMVTPVLFREFPTPQAMAEASLPAIEEIIRPTGFFRNKSKSIVGAAKRLVSEFGGKVPRTMDELLTLPGVARKTANVVLGVAYGIAVGIVVDTHVLRLSRRLQLTLNTDPRKVEQDLVKIIPQDHWIDFSHELILHGRQVCIARKPRCPDCAIEKQCNSADKTWSSH